MSSESIALYIYGSAHHLDLRAPNDADPKYVTDARAIELEYIQKWIAEYNSIAPQYLLKKEYTEREGFMN